MRKIFVCILASLAGLGSAAGQSIQSSVVGSTGAFFSSAGGSLSWTLGEVATETFTKSPGILTQGFHQPTTVKVTGLDDTERAAVAYPNPVKDFIHIQVAEQGTYQAELFNLHGQRLINEETGSLEPGQAYSIDVRGLATAMYLIRVHNTSDGKTHWFKIEKY